MASNIDRTPQGTPDRNEGTTPYGPHRGHVDEASGGADSSPLETEPSASKQDAARAPGRSRGDQPDPQFPQPDDR